jgi:tetratricopeptide (TPR) repeat protein
VRRPWICLVAVGLWYGSAALSAASARRAVPPPATDARSVDARLADVYRSLYNLDRTEALDEARQLVSSTPNSSSAHRALATVLWLDVLFARGALTIDTYLGGVSRAQLDLPKPPPALDAEFKQEIDRAIDLADTDLRRHPQSASAMHDLGTAFGLQASYVASVQGSVVSAFGPARRAFDLEERVLARDPGRVEAGAIVGTYRYSVASLGLASRLVAYLAGFGGDKARGIALLEAAGRAGTSRAEALTALALIYSREGRHDDAFRVLSDLAVEFPRNRLFELERGAAAIRAGHAGQAEAILTRGLAAFDADARPKLPGERALWLYKRGSARVALNHPADAAVDLEAAMRSGPVDWVRGRLEYELGRVADLQGHREAALGHYRAATAIASRTNDAIGARDAQKYLDRPFAMPH